nr:PqqD family protein [Propionicimonas sp.]
MKLRTSDVTWREIDGDLVVLDLRSSTYFTANGAAGVLMKQLAEERTDVQLQQSLVDEYGIAQSQAAEDVRAFLDDLERAGLLEQPVGR